MRSFLLFSLLGLTASSCIPYPLEQSICRTSEGDIDTYNVIGVWKKDPITDREEANYSEGNFRLLYIVQGGADAVLEGDEFDNIEVYYNSAICEKVISNGIETKITKVGLYYHDDARSRIKTNILDVEEEDTEPTEELVRYSFSGNCGTTKLHLTRGTQTESYTFFASEPPSTSCKVAE